MKCARTMLLVLMLAAARPLPAQGPVVETKSGARPPTWTPIRVAKWAMLGGAIGLGMYAMRNSRVAERSYEALRERCYGVEGACSVVNGRYQDAASEALYQGALGADRRAQFGIYGGQLAVIGTVGLFIYDLRNDPGPSDIPLPSRRAIGLGGRINW